MNLFPHSFYLSSLPSRPCALTRRSGDPVHTLIKAKPGKCFVVSRLVSFALAGSFYSSVLYETAASFISAATHFFLPAVALDRIFKLLTKAAVKYRLMVLVILPFIFIDSLASL